MMHTILALSVIVLHHVDSYSCRSIIGKLDDRHLKHADDPTESYELNNDEMVELLRPIFKSGQAETLKHQPLQKNLAKLIIEPYIENNQTHEWERNPHSRFKKLKTIAPLAIILTHLPDLKSQVQRNMPKKNFVADKSGNNNLYLTSSIPNDETQHHPIKPNIYEKSPEEVLKINMDKEENIVSDMEGNKQVYYENNIDNSKTPKPLTGEIYAKVDTKSEDVISTGDQGLNDINNNDSQDYTDIHSKINLKTNPFADEGNFIQSTKPIEAVHSDGGDSVFEDFTIDLTELNYRDDSAEDKIQDDIISVSSIERTSLAQDKGKSQDLNQHHQDIEVGNEENIKDHSKIDSLNAATTSSENGDLIFEKKNNDQIIVEGKKQVSTEDVTKNDLTYHQIPLDDMEQKYFDLGSHEERSGAQQDHVHSYEDPIRNYFSESGEEMNREHVTKDSHENQHMNLYSQAEDSRLEDKNLSEELFEDNAPVSSVKHAVDEPKPITPDIDKEMKIENLTEGSLQFQAEKEHKERSSLHHDIPDWHHYHPHEVYNLCFHFNK